MIKAFKFFVKNLTTSQTIAFGLCQLIHLYCLIQFLEGEKYLYKHLIHILNGSRTDIVHVLLMNAMYMFAYSVTMAIIECFGKFAIRNAVSKRVNQLLHINLSLVNKNDYERDVLSLVKHANNIELIISNLFVEFPKKVINCCHFIIALNELSTDVMLYCIGVNLILLLISYFIVVTKERIATKLTTYNIDFNIMAATIADSIQTYKVDDRENECIRKIDCISNNILKVSSYDSAVNAFSESITTFSSQFMIGILAYYCQSSTKFASAEDVMYGIRSSSKFIEKMIGVVEYVGSIIRQYASFKYFGQNIIIDTNIGTDQNCYKCCENIFANSIEIINDGNCIVSKNDNDYNYIMLICGANGIGKTTMLLQFLGISYLGANSKGVMRISKESYSANYFRKLVGFVDQNIPKTKDTVEEYIKAVSKTDMGVTETISRTLHYFSVQDDSKINNSIISPNLSKAMRDLSGGQAKMIQIIATICKLYINKSTVLILDEPSNNLDPKKIKFLIELLDKLCRQGIQIYMVSHDDRLINNDNCKLVELK